MLKTKTASSSLLILYLVVLVWLILFKFSSDFLTILNQYQTRSLNIIPFAGASFGNINELLYNFVVFIPFGLLLGINFKKLNFKWKLALIFSLSLGAELLQYIFAIGTTDITDLITNTAGGFVGL